MTSRHRLDNGLTVLINEDHAAPVAAVLTLVKTGYFDEEDRLTGVSHLLEHMYFKGTTRRPGPEDIARDTKALGGILNAFTYYEETGYYTVVPSDRLMDALDIQADALANTRIDPEELRRETEVVLQEAEQKKDTPWAYATEMLHTLAFERHRIRRWRIGEPETLRSWTRDDVAGYYRSAYRPENIILVVSGDVDTERTREAVERHYGGLSGGSPAASPGPREEPQTAPRTRRLHGDICQRLCLIGFHTPPVFHPDSHALDILAAVLSDGRSSRLYQNVRERKGLANVVNAYQQSFRDIGFFVMAAESLSADLAETERAILAEVAALQDAPPEEAEIARVRTRLKARLMFSEEEPLGRARRLATYEALGGYELEAEDLQRLMAVTPEDVQRVTREYLTTENMSLLEYVPCDDPAAPEGGLLFARDTEPRAAADAGEGPHDLGVVGAAGIVAEPPGQAEDEARLGLPSGGVLAARRSGSVPVAALEMLFPGGRVAETAQNAGITALTLRCILKGNARRNGERIAQAFEGMGSNLEWVHGVDFWGFGFQSLSERFAEALALAADVMTTPDFAPADVERERETLLADLRRALDNSGDRAMDLLDMAAYAGHPYGIPDRGTEEALRAITPEDVRAWHARMMTSPLVAGAGGAVAATPLRDLMATLLPTEGAQVAAAPAPEPWSGVVERVEQRDRKQTAAAMGFATVDALGEDRFALAALAQILSGLGGRLFAEVRGRRGLAYTVMAWHMMRRDAGMFVTYTATAPEKEDEARAAILTEFDRLRQEPVTAPELDRVKAYIAGSKRISLQTSRAQARDLSRAAMYGHPQEASRLYVERVQALSAEDLQRTAQRYFHTSRYALGVLRGASSAG